MVTVKAAAGSACPGLSQKRRNPHTTLPAMATPDTTHKADTARWNRSTAMKPAGRSATLDAFRAPHDQHATARSAREGGAGSGGASVQLQADRAGDPGAVVRAVGCGFVISLVLVISGSFARSCALDAPHCRVVVQVARVCQRPTPIREGTHSGSLGDDSAMTATDDHLVTFTAPETILFSGDVERAAGFYKQLGFTETFRVPQEGTPIHVDLQLDGYKIGFASIDSARQDHGLDPATSGQRATITLWTHDTAKAYQTLTAAGVPGLAAPSTWLDRLLIAWVQDPDGHPIQLVQRLEEHASSAAP